MSRRLAGVGLGIGLLVCLGASPGAQGQVRVTGRVVAADDGQPIRRVMVLLSNPSFESHGTATDDDGRFELIVPSGPISLRVQKTGFVQRTISPAVQLKPGMTHDFKEVRLIRAGVITGRVIDEFGEPAQTTVVALRATYSEPGVRHLSAVGAAATNDRGDYRIFDLAPGTYFVSVGSMQPGPVVGNVRLVQVPAGVARVVGEPSSQSGKAPTFHPGTAAELEAHPVVVDPGGEALGIDIRIAGVPLARFTGRVLDSKGQPAKDEHVVLSALPAGGSHSIPPVRAVLDDGGRFRFQNLAPGSYRVDVVATASMGAITESTPNAGRTAPEFASLQVDIAGDVLDMTINTTPGARVVGRVLVDGNVPAAGAVEGIRVGTAPMFGHDGPARITLLNEAFVGPDASFTILGVLGPRIFQVGGLPPGLTVSAVTTNGVDAADGVDFKGGMVAAEVRLSTRATIVAGDVVDAAGNPPRDTSVVIFSDDSKQWTKPKAQAMALALVTADGKFSSAALRPGRYYVAAIPTPDAHTWADPIVLERLRSKATLVTVLEGQTTTTRLTLR